MFTYTAPSFQSARQTISDGTDHIDPAGLRGLGPDQTLVLVNGKRRHNSALVNINGTVGRGSVGTDLNAIPVAAIERIEVLRDGAAAQYGSDAIAGVINVVLKKKYKGFNLSTMAGQNFTNVPYGGGQNIQDGLTTQIDFSGGWGWDNGAYVNVTGQWLKRENTNRSGFDNIPLIYNGNGGGLPGSAIPSGVTANDYYRWLMDLDRAYEKDRKYSRRNIVAGNSANENTGFFVNAGAPVTKTIDFYLTTGITNRTGSASGFSRNPNSWSQQAVKANGQRYYFDGFLPQIHTTLKDYSLLAGLTFKLGEWSIDLSNTRGENTLKYDIKNTGNSSLPATDNVQTEFYAGELAFLQNTMNLDFTRKVDLADASTSLNLAFGAEYRYERFRIGAGEANSYINGGRQFQPEPIPPYPGTSTYFTFAPGTAVSGSQVFPGFQPGDEVHATRNIYAAYGDVEYQGRNFIIGGALRYETYDEFQLNYNNVSGKITGRVDITSKVAVRASLSTGFRAPSLHQRYFQNTSTQFVGGLPSNALTANNYNPIVTDAFGVEALTPETSKSITAGLVGTLAKGLTFTIDGYFIRIDDRIVLSTQFNRSNPKVNEILNDAGVDPSVSALQFWTNAVNTETKGVDVVLTQRFRFGDGNATLSIAGNVNHNYVVGPINTNSVIDNPENNPSESDPNANPANDFKNALFDRQQRSRIEVAQPRSKLNFTFTYDLRKFGFLVRAVRFGETQYVHNLDPNSKNENTNVYFNDVGFGTDQTFAARWTTDLVLTLKLHPAVSMNIGANNLFDVYPERVFIDSRNDPSAYYNAPVSNALGVNKTTGGFNAARDASNRGRFLFNPNQFGYNGRFLFARLNIDLYELTRTGGSKAK